MSSILCGVGGDCGGVDLLCGDRMETGVSLGLFGSKVNNGIFFFSGVVSLDFGASFFSQGIKDHIESRDAIPN